MIVPHRLLPLLKEAEDAAATGGIVAALPVLRQMTKDEFATVLGGVSAEFAALRATLPIYPSPEIQRAWTGNTDTLLLQKTALFSHVCERFSARLRGRPLADARILDYGCGWGRLTRQMLYFSDPASLFGVDPWHKSLEQCETLRVPGTILQIDYRPQSLPEDVRDIHLSFAFSVMTHIGESNTEEILRAVRQSTAPNGLFVFTIRPREYWAPRTSVLGEAGVAEMLHDHDEKGVAFLPSGETRNAGSADYGESSFTVEAIAALAAETGWRFAGTEWLLIDPYQLIVCLQRAS
jgi:hypothetical protein